MHTDWSDPGSEPGARDILTAELDPAGQFKGQWLRIESLDDPVPSYALQMTEVEVYGVPEGGTKLLLAKDPETVVTGLGRTATFSVGVNVINGDSSLLAYRPLNSPRFPDAASMSVGEKASGAVIDRPSSNPNVNRSALVRTATTSGGVVLFRLIPDLK